MLQGLNLHEKESMIHMRKPTKIFESQQVEYVVHEVKKK